LQLFKSDIFMTLSFHVVYKSLQSSKSYHGWNQLFVQLRITGTRKEEKECLYFEKKTKKTKSVMLYPNKLPYIYVELHASGAHNAPEILYSDDEWNRLSPFPYLTRRL